MSEPRVGVILPCYNEEDWIEGAIESVLDQRYENFRLLVVDDGSTDATGDIATSFDDSRIRYIYQDNRGDAGARNTALEESDTEFYAFIDADDRWNPDKLARQMDILDSTDAAFVHSNATYIDADDRIIGTHHEDPDSIPSTRDRTRLLRQLFFNNFVCTSSVVCHRSAIGDKRFDESLYANSDHDMWLRIASEHGFEYVPEPLLRYRFHEGNISKNYERLFEDRRRISNRAVSRYNLPEDVMERKLSNVYLTYGINLILDGEIGDGRDAIRIALRHDPTNWRGYVTYGLSFVSRDLIQSLSKAGAHYE